MHCLFNWNLSRRCSRGTFLVDENNVRLEDNHLDIEAALDELFDYIIFNHSSLDSFIKDTFKIITCRFSNIFSTNSHKNDFEILDVFNLRNVILKSIESYIYM